jgi:hypothetical protein
MIIPCFFTGIERCSALVRDDLLTAIWVRAIAPGGASWVHA